MSDTQPVPAGRRRPRGFETVGDMLRSLGVVLAAVAVILLITLRAHPAAVTVVDPTQARQAVQAEAKFAAEEPAGLSSRWRLTSARFQSSLVSPTGADVWHLGWVTPNNGYAALEQSDGPASLLLRSVLDGAVQVGAGAGPFSGWQRWTGSPAKWQAYVRQVGPSTLVVYGSASDAELAQLVAALQPPLR